MRGKTKTYIVYENMLSHSPVLLNLNFSFISYAVHYCELHAKHKQRLCDLNCDGFVFDNLSLT